MRKITPIHWRKLAKVFELDGWKLSRIKGDHLIYTKKGFPRPVVIPKDREVEVFIILNNLRTAKISREKYFKLLQKI
jgi:predicted RNA binding protein YcfA (HicA-like mRNA interferase family)